MPQATTYVINPLTGKKIDSSGKTAKNLLKMHNKI